MSASLFLRSGFRVSNFGIQVSVVESWVTGFVFRVSYNVLRVTSFVFVPVFFGSRFVSLVGVCGTAFWFWFLDLLEAHWFQNSGFVVWISCFGFWVEVSGFELRFCDED